MVNAVMIQETEIGIKEYRGKRVVTFKDIDAVHQRPEGTAHRNFKANRQRFINGVDFYSVTPKELQNELQTNFVPNLSKGGNPNNPITLITESGYLMLVKSFTDDLAWRVQRELVDAYFRVKAFTEHEASDSTVIDTDKLIRCAEIMGSCLEGNRKYVILILKNIFPDLASYMEDVPVQEDTEDVSVKVPIKKVHICKAGYAEPFNHRLMDSVMYEKDISNGELERRVGCSEGLAGKWRRGRVSPSEYYRVLICEALEVPQEYFNGRRRRRIQR